MRTGAYPLAFVINEKNAGMPVACIKIRQGADMEKATEHIRQTFKEIDPAYPVEIEYYETIIRQLYRDEIRTGRIVSASCLASVLISLSGILGLVLFETQYRRREIAIRKVLGATVKDVLYRFNRTYLMVLIVSFVISVPVSIYFAGEWLKNFAYKVPLDWMVYVVSFFSILLLTVFVVTLQTWRTANENPVKSLSFN
ncbi:FtsX-like permease family protein [Parabacteroides goldsteinii]|uniref:ABC transporter permease n=1 Tax=Parabacteroides goldsteinii TaxID=328812 RepID=UPI002ABB612B|nr:FtsX-like permease family protein [Parabacteroides goldsteinii]MDZ3929606.1 FtsX-like permease family protein [Parabacteroides goldsteinii]